MQALLFVLVAASPPLSRDDAVVQALRHHPRITAGMHELRAAHEGVAAARPLVTPTLSFAPWLGSANGTTEEFLFLQPLETNGARGARAALALSRVSASAAALQLERLSVAHTVRLAYDALAYRQAQETLAQDILTLTAELDRLTARQVELGARPGIEATQTRIEVARAQQQLAQVQGERKAAQSALALLLGSDTPPTVVPLPLATAPLPPLPPAARPELALEKAQTERLHGEAQVAQKALQPDLAVMLRSQNLFHPSRPSDRGAALQLSVPLDWGAGRARLRQLDAATHAQKARESAVALQLQQERQQVQAKLETAATILESYAGELLQRSERLVSASKTGFQAGQTSLTAVLEAQRTYKNVLSERLSAAYAYAQARTEWERVMGMVPAQ